MQNDLLHFLRTRSDFRFFGFAGQKEQLLALLDRHQDGWRSVVVAEAEEICEHRFHIFGAGPYCFDQKIDWHLDYTTGRRWPMIYSPDIPYRGSDRIGDIKYPWELSRHQYLPVLGLAYWATGDQKYTREFMDQVLSWLEDNPFLRGVHWICALETGLRLTSWLFAFSFFKDSPELDKDFTDLLCRALWQKCDFIQKNLSQGLYENNHLIGEATGLFIGGLFLQGFKQADQWVETATNILIAQVEKQTHGDGVNVEQAVHYQRFSMDFFTLFKLLHDLNLGPLPQETDKKLEKMYDFLSAVIRPDGSEPPYGDCDNARGIPLEHDEQKALARFIGLGGAIYKRPDMKWLAGSELSTEMILLLGPEASAQYVDLEAVAPERFCRIFREGGYMVSRSSRHPDAHYLLFDCGPLGYGSGAHGHADALSVQLMLFGRQVLIDPGTYAYNQDLRYRDYFRSTRAHNTISVDGLDQAQIVDRMNWQTIPGSKVVSCCHHDFFDAMVAEHDGFSRLPSPVNHQRTVLFCKDPLYCLILDHLSASAPHAYQLHYHFPAQAKVAWGTENGVVEIDSQLHVHMAVQGSNEIQSKVRQGGDQPIMGWSSSVYGHKEPSPSLIHCMDGDGDQWLLTVVRPFTVGQDPPPAVLVSYDQGTIAVELDLGHCRDLWLINRQHGTGGQAEQGIEFSGRALLLRYDGTESLALAAGHGVRSVTVDGRSCFADKVRKDGLLFAQN